MRWRRRADVADASQPDRRSPVGRCFDWWLRNTLKPMTRAEGLGLYIALVVIGLLAINHFTSEGHARRKQTESIQGQALSIKAQAESQSAANRRQSEAIIATNRQSHYDDCVNANSVRRGLRENVIQGQKQLPIFLKLLPQFNTPQVRELNDQSVKRQLRDFRPRHCHAYAEEVVPPGERAKFKHVPLVRPLKLTR